MKRFPAIVALRSILLLSPFAPVQQAVGNSWQDVAKAFDAARAETHVRGRGWRAALEKINHICDPLEHLPPVL